MSHILKSKSWNVVHDGLPEFMNRMNLVENLDSDYENDPSVYSNRSFSITTVDPVEEIDCATTVGVSEYYNHPYRNYTVSTPNYHGSNINSIIHGKRESSNYTSKQKSSTKESRKISSKSCHPNALKHKSSHKQNDAYYGNKSKVAPSEGYHKAIPIHTPNSDSKTYRPVVDNVLTKNYNHKKSIEEKVALIDSKDRREEEKTTKKLYHDWTPTKTYTECKKDQSIPILTNKVKLGGSLNQNNHYLFQNLNHAKSIFSTCMAPHKFTECSNQYIPEANINDDSDIEIILCTEDKHGWFKDELVLGMSAPTDSQPVIIHHPPPLPIYQLSQTNDLTNTSQRTGTHEDYDEKWKRYAEENGLVPPKFCSEDYTSVIDSSDSSTYTISPSLSTCSDSGKSTSSCEASETKYCSSTSIPSSTSISSTSSVAYEANGMVYYGANVNTTAVPKRKPNKSSYIYTKPKTNYVWTK